MGVSKIAIITGGASGIGLAVAKSVAAKGYKVIVLSRNQVSHEFAQKELNSEASYVQLDVKDYDGLRKAFQDIWADHGRIDFGQ